MQVSFSSIFSNTVQINNRLKKSASYNTNSVNTLSNDVFVKSDKISFKGFSSCGTDKTDIKDTIIGSSAVGAAFLIPLIMATAIAKSQNPDEIFLSDGTYLGNAREMFVDKNKASELGFELDPARFKGPNCFCDEINGVYKDFKNGIDINIKDGKYVDLNKGIYVNPEDQTSVIFTKGDAVPIIIPSFGGASIINGSGVPVYDKYDPLSPEHIAYMLNMKEYLPERENAPFSYLSKEELNEYNGMFHRSFITKERDKYIAHHQAAEPEQSFYERVKEFFAKPQEEKGFKTDLYDIWGREIITLNDKTGQTHYVALTDDLSDLMHKQHVSYETAQALLAHMAEHPIQNYIKGNYADYLNNLHFENPSMENFLEQIKHNNSDYQEQEPNSVASLSETFIDIEANEDSIQPRNNQYDGNTEGSFLCNDDISYLV